MRYSRSRLIPSGVLTCDNPDRARASANAVVLLVDDNPGDLALMSEAMGDSASTIALRPVCGGASAIRYLQHVESGDTVAPALIILDINMPGTDGFAVLAHVRSTHRLMQIPVFMLSSSELAGDVSRSERLGADGYLQKPVRYDDYLRMAQKLSLWLNRAPRKPANDRLSSPRQRHRASLRLTRAFSQSLRSRSSRRIVDAAYTPDPDDPEFRRIADLL